MTHAEFKKKALEMFDGQFPNEITMRKANPMFLDSKEYNIREELRGWIDVTIDKYQELVGRTE